jgi:hypothetical protein
MTIDLHIEDGDQIIFEKHNDNVFILELGDDNRIWVSWKALTILRRAIDDAWRNEKLPPVPASMMGATRRGSR